MPFVARLAAQVTALSPWPANNLGAVTTHQAVTPAGVSITLPARVSGVAFDGNDNLWTLAGNSLYLVDRNRSLTWRAIDLGGRPAWHGIQMDPANNLPLLLAAAPGRDAQGRAEPVRIVRWRDGQLSDFIREIGNAAAGNVAAALHPDPQGRRLGVVPLTAQNRVALVDLDGGRLLAHLPAGQAPFAAAISRDGAVVYVSNWGGRLAQPGDRTAGGARVVTDPRGVASTGTLTKFDLAAQAAKTTIPTELHPTALAWDQDRARLYVANSNSDSLTIVDTASDQVLRHLPLKPFTAGKFGITPTALALSHDGLRLYIACAGINAVAVLNTQSLEIEGLVPTAWYPVSLSLSFDGAKLAIGCLYGAGSGTSGAASRKSIFNIRGVVSVVDLPDRRQLREYTLAVAANTGLPPDALPGDTSPGPPACPAAGPVPHCLGDASPIKKTVLIIKENRTYDQIFGDLGRGNGDPSLVLYGRRVTPNQHKLAEEFVTLDNFYATGFVSADGHQWLTQAYASSYTQWQGYTGRSNPFDGTDPIAYSSQGFLWDLARAHGKSVRVFGEFAPARPDTRGQYRALLAEWLEGARNFRLRFSTSSQIPGLNDVLIPDYPAYTMAIPDVVRAEIFLAEFRQWVEAGEMPDLTLLQLPVNHTVGTTPGEPTPQAMIADNDHALGLIVHELTHSPFWKEMAIFVVEDDAQDGVDHVDGHRSPAQVISPYTRRGHVDSTFYSHQSVLKTIELIHGLPPLTLFDLIAPDMRNAFQPEPDLTPFEALEPQINLMDANPQLGALNGQLRRDAAASAKMNWRVPDEAPWPQLNRILWRQAKGLKTPYPTRRTAALKPWLLE